MRRVYEGTCLAFVLAIIDCRRIRCEHLEEHFDMRLQCFGDSLPELQRKDSFPLPLRAPLEEWEHLADQVGAVGRELSLRHDDRLRQSVLVNLNPLARM